MRSGRIVPITDCAVVVDLSIFPLPSSSGVSFVSIFYIFTVKIMDSTQYLDALIAEKSSLDPSYHPNAMRLLAEGKRAVYLIVF